MFGKGEESSPELPKNSWQFAVIGDTEGLRPVTETMLADMKQRGLAFVVHVGDISSDADTNELQQVKEAFAALPFPTYYVPGNNDLVYDETTERRTLKNYHDVIDEREYYAVDYRTAHIVLLNNSYRRIGFSDEELAWLKEDLDASRDKLNFLFFHRPLDVPGQAFFGDDETPNSRAQNETFKTLINDYAIAHMFNGHIHTALSYDLNNTPVTVTGGGGAAPQAILGGEDAALYHYELVTVNEDEKTPSYAVERITLEEIQRAALE